MKTELMGIALKNPVIIAAGPWNRDGESIRKGIASGAAAVVTETIVSDAKPDVRPRIAYNGLGAQNIRLYSDIQIEGWEREMKIAKSGGGIVIASVSAQSPSELAYLASKMEKFGADALELDISAPMGESFEVVAASPERVYDITRGMVEHVKIPVMVKLSQNTTNINLAAKAAKKAGASAVSAINTVRCILSVDIETAMPSLNTYGGYSGPAIRPLGLASVASVAQTVKIPICGIGGIETYRNVLEYLMLGASAVQVGTSVMLRGVQAITEIVRELEDWSNAHEFSDVKQVRGKALAHLKPYEEIKIEAVISRVIGTGSKENWEECIACCIYDAIQKQEDRLVVDTELCTGCGLCTSMFPDQFRLGW